MTPTMQNPAIMPNPIAVQNPIAKTSFLKGLFNFDNFIASRLVKVIYAVGAALILLATIGASLMWIFGGLYLMFSYSLPLSTMVSQILFIALQTIITIVAGALGILSLRLYCELILAIFKINENLQMLRNRNAQI
jgi:hypothetical protein